MKKVRFIILKCDYRHNLSTLFMSRAFWEYYRTKNIEGLIPFDSPIPVVGDRYGKDVNPELYEQEIIDKLNNLTKGSKAFTVENIKELEEYARKLRWREVCKK